MDLGARFFKRRLVIAPIDVGFFIGVIGVIALAIVGALSYLSARRLRGESAWVTHTYEVLNALAVMQNAAAAGEANPVLSDAVARVRGLVRGNPAQVARLDSLPALDLAHRDEYLADVARMHSEQFRLLRAHRTSAERWAVRSNAIIVLSTILAVLLMGIALVLLHQDLERRRAAEDALRDSEARFRSLIEQAADAIVLVNAEARCVDGNARAAEIMGVSKADIAGIPLSSFVFADESGRAAALPFLHYGHITRGEYVIRRPDGSFVPVEVRAALLEDGHVQIIARDVSERREIEHAKDQFVSIVSHELRTPLTSIRGALGLLAAGRLDAVPEKKKRMLELAASNTDRLIRLINDILDVERISSGNAPLERQSVAAIPIIEHAVDTLQPFAEKAGVELQWAGEDLEINADQDRITQTLTNLIGNAIKFSPAGSVLRVSVRRDRSFAQFAVADEGRGIPADKLESIFVRFQQVDASDSREKGGTGLGLAISRGIVQAHGGRIWVESEVGRGSVFRFTIPLASQTVAKGVESNAARVIVCDDDVDLLEVLRLMIEDCGLRTDIATTGRDAIGLIEAAEPGVLVLDMVLPDLRGIDVLRHLHARWPSARCIVYTAVYLEPDDRAFIRASGGVILTKSRTTPEQLVDEVLRLAGPSNDSIRQKIG